MKFISVYCCLFLFCIKIQAQTKPWAGRTNVFVGDSYTDGYSMNDYPVAPSQRYTSVLSSFMGSNEDNRGLSGRVVQSGAGCPNDVASLALIPQKAPEHLFLFIALGLNDIGLDNGLFNPTAYKSRLTLLVEDALNKNWPAVNIVLVTPFWVPTEAFSIYANQCAVNGKVASVERQEAYAQAVKDIAAEKNVVLADIYTAVKNMPVVERNPFFRPNDKLHYTIEGYQYIANFLAGLEYSPEALPLTLTHFYLKRNSNSIHLKWVTENEIDTREFIVERSADGFNFNPIGKVAASGNTKAAKEYLFTDVQPLRGVNIYRKKMVDLDGSFTYSKSILATYASEMTFSIYPNPAKRKLTIYRSEQDHALLQVLNLSGAVVHTERLFNRMTEISLDRFAAGLYLFRVTGKNGPHMEKVLVQ